MTIKADFQVDTAAAKRIWDEYQRTNDLSDRIGQTAGIDPASQRIWFGESIEQVVERRDADGCNSPLYFARVGSPAYYRKGGRR